MEFENYSLWERLAAETRPIFMYGTGNGGDKIFAALESYGVRLEGVFASNEFVRDRYFHEHRVRRYSDVTAEYGDDIVVLLAFGTTLESVREFIYALDVRHELIIPDVPLYGGDLFDMKYFLSHRDILEQTASLLADDLSKRLFYDAVNFRLTGKIKYLENTNDARGTISELLHGQNIEVMIDGGAFKGDSAAEFIDAIAPKKIIAVEADPKTFVKLAAYAESERRAEIIPVNAALGSVVGEAEYVSSGSRGSGRDGKNHRANTAMVRCATIDELSGDSVIDLIKLDVEGSEECAIYGGSETIKRCKPNMAVSLYHRTDDLYALINTIHDMLPSHKLHLGRVPCIPMWDLTLFAVKILRETA